MSSKTKTIATNEEATPALVPKLRFPEFRDAEGWKGVPLSELVGALDAGVSVNSGDRPATGNEIGVLKTSAVTNGIFEPQENKVVFDEVERGRVKEPVQGGTIIISRMNTPALVGANAYVETSLENIYLPDRLWAAKSKPGTSMRFVASILGSEKGRAALSKLAKGSSGSMKNITKPDVLAFLIVAPSPAEQQKIAECLSSVDELIAAQARKLDALRTHKKGLMQQLFPREGETQPSLRFPEFQNAGEWEEKALGAMSKTTIGEFVIKTKQRPDAPYPVFNGGRSHTGLYDQFNNEGNKIVISARGANAGYVNLVKQRYWAGNSCYSVTLNDRNDCLDFVYWFMKHNEKAFTDNQHAANIPAVSKGHVECFRIMLPSPEEQHRIATCLSSLDALITAETQKLEALKTHKKGLMQQLFPSPEEVEA
jgi:restriction endonuclease S subunit